MCFFIDQISDQGWIPLIEATNILPVLLNGLFQQRLREQIVRNSISYSGTSLLSTLAIGTGLSVLIREVSSLRVVLYTNDTFGIPLNIEVSLFQSVLIRL